MPENTIDRSCATTCASRVPAAPDDMDLRLSRSWLRVGIAAVFAGQGMMFSLAVAMTPPPYGSVPYWFLHGGLIVSALAVMLFLGGPLFASTWSMLRERRLSIEGLFTLSLLGAFTGSLAGTLTGRGGVYYEVVAVVVAIHTIGRMIGERSRAKWMLESEALRERFDHAMVPDGGGAATRMPLSELVPGCTVRVGPGEPFTVDGVVRSGVGYVRETALTGEPLPTVRHPGDSVRAGTWSEDGLFEVEARALEGGREIDAILRTVEEAAGRPSDMQRQADRLMGAFLPLVAGVAIATGVFWALADGWTAAVLNAMAVLLVACPCALGLATPVAIWRGLFKLARLGLVSRDGALIDALAETRHVFFDKTGTLGESVPRVTEILVAEAWRPRRDGLLAAVRAVEAQARHPVARGIAAGVGGGVAAAPRVAELRLVPGSGVEAEVATEEGGALALRIGETALAPSADAAEQAAAGEAALRERGGKRVHVFAGGLWAAAFVLRERPRAGLDRVWDGLRRLGVRATVLTGDPSPAMEFPGDVEVRAGMSAADKVARVDRAGAAGESPILVGDGINDAGAMARAAASVAMGGGAPLTRSVASASLSEDRLTALPEAIVLARDVRRRLRGNLVYAACYNGVGMALAAAGLLHPVAAALIMLVSSFFVTTRALRAGGPD